MLNWLTNKYANLMAGLEHANRQQQGRVNSLTSYVPEYELVSGSGPANTMYEMFNPLRFEKPITTRDVAQFGLNALMPGPEQAILPMFALTKQGARWTNKAKDVFGETWSPSEAGYIAHDGTLLDFSGRNQGSGGGQRYLDHRDIWEAMGSKGKGGTQGMYQFMNNADAIRMGSYGGGRGEKASLTLHVMKKPTSEQLSQIREILPYHNEVYLDIVKPTGESIKSYELFEPRMEEIKNIFGKHFFKRLY